MSQPHPSRIRHSAAERLPCQWCGDEYNIRGLKRHEAACKRTQETTKTDQEYENELRQRRTQTASERDRSSRRPGNRTATRRDFGIDQPSQWDYMQLDDDNTYPQDNHGQDPYNVAAEPYWLDDIRTEYHPHSALPTKVEHFEDYKRHQKGQPSTPCDKEPWSPFRSRIDFEFAEIALKAALNKDLANSLIKLVHRSIAEQGAFTLESHADMQDMWDKASAKLTTFESEKFAVPFKGEEEEYEVFFRPLWGWATDLLDDPQLAPFFVWDAQRLSKFNGTSFVRFFDEPWTADRMWDIQSQLPATGKPFCIILYADKTNLSSFGTTKGYPVIARCAQLPTEVRNGKGLGGGSLVGWLPIVQEDAFKTNQGGFANFKNIVWHESFLRILRSIMAISKTGCWYKCADGILRHLFPLILILSADYEEQCLMALIRRSKGFCPCPICFVEMDKQSDLSEDWPLRTAENTKTIIKKGREIAAATSRDDYLKDYSLRDIDNAFWSVANSDPHAALSWDRMHAYHSGLFRKHIWPVLQTAITNLGREEIRVTDYQMSILPRWRNLNHFNKVMGISFTDATKYEHISKGILFAAYNLFDPLEHPDIYLLLCGLRSYLEIDMYASFEVHTEETIAAGRKALLKFSSLMKEYVTISEGSKSWNFPKMHTHRHLFDDIEAKGVTRNYNTKPSESLHKPLKQSYKLRTNFKDIAPQILRVDHCCLVSALIRAQLDELDDVEDAEADPDGQPDDIQKGAEEDSVSLSDHISLGAEKPPCTLEAVEEDHSSDPRFQAFRTRLAKFFNTFLPAYKIPFPNGQPIKFRPTDLVKEYCFLKANYESMVDWRLTTDYLRCSPKFHNRPRYDCVIISTTEKIIFGQLIFVFTCTLDGSDASYPIALIHPFSVPTGPPPQLDRDLGFIRLKKASPNACEFISIHSIIRGALIAEDFANPGDFLVVDILDADMFLRLKGFI